jgi:hypothetical protein
MPGHSGNKVPFFSLICDHCAFFAARHPATQKGPVPSRGLSLLEGEISISRRPEPPQLSLQRYFSEVLIELNMVFRLLPRPLTAARIAIEMPAAIRPYSMAVAPRRQRETAQKSFSCLALKSLINSKDDPSPSGSNNRFLSCILGKFEDPLTSECRKW